MSTQFTNKFEVLHSKLLMKIQLSFDSVATFLNGLLLVLTVCFFILLLSCGAKNNQPDLSAIPHAEALPDTELSSEDKAKLIKASGKTIDQISIKGFQNMLEASEGQLYLYALWNSKCAPCFENINNLKAHFANNPTDDIKVITINIGDEPNTANLSLRSENIVFESYHLSNPPEGWTKLIDEEWDGNLPSLFMVNKSDDLFLSYYKVMDENELEAILQTLVL